MLGEGYLLDHVEVQNLNMIKIDNEQVCEAFAVLLTYLSLAKQNVDRVWSRGINQSDTQFLKILACSG